MGGRRILKSARMLPFEMCLETVIVSLSAILLSLCLHYLHENRELATGNGTIRDLPVRPHTYSCIWLLGESWLPYLVNF